MLPKDILTDDRLKKYHQGWWEEMLQHKLQCPKISTQDYIPHSIIVKYLHVHVCGNIQWQS